MGKTLIVGGATGYDWNKLKHWVNSINDSGFGGDVAIVASDITKETIEKLNENGINVSTYGNQTADGGFKRHGNQAPHVERFFWIWNYLNNVEVDYEHVIVTDTRDVIFQDNPDTFLREYCKVRPIIASSEGLTVQNEPWNWENVNQTFGPFFGEKILKNTLILNVGVIAGKKSHVRDLMMMIFQMSLNRPIPIVDQAVFNFLISQEPYQSQTYRTNNDDAWAAQMGATIYAVEAGSGDLGQFGNKEKYLKDYIGDQPKIENGMVFNSKNNPFIIVHQWDRVPQLKDVVEKKYGA